MKLISQINQISQKWSSKLRIIHFLANEIERWHESTSHEEFFMN
jgi:hypothetical protein